MNRQQQRNLVYLCDSANGHFERAVMAHVCVPIAQTVFPSLVSYISRYSQWAAQGRAHEKRSNVTRSAIVTRNKSYFILL